jgi:hypothetical protein
MAGIKKVRINKNLIFKFNGKTWKTVERKNKSWNCVNISDVDETIIISSVKIATSIKEDAPDTKNSTESINNESIENIRSKLTVGTNFFDEFGNVMIITEKLPDGFWLCQINSTTDEKNNDEDIVIYYSKYIAISIHYFGVPLFFKGVNPEDVGDADETKKIKQRNSSKKYNESEIGKEALRRYRMSDKGREAIRKAVKKYFSTEKGKAAKSRYMKKYKARPEVQERQRERDRARDRTEYMRNYMRERRKKAAGGKNTET